MDENVLLLKNQNSTTTHRRSSNNNNSNTAKTAKVSNSSPIIPPAAESLSNDHTITTTKHSNPHSSPSSEILAKVSGILGKSLLVATNRSSRESNQSSPPQQKLDDNSVRGVTRKMSSRRLSSRSARLLPDDNKKRLSVEDIVHNLTNPETGMYPRGVNTKQLFEYTCRLPKDDRPNNSKNHLLVLLSRSVEKGRMMRLAPSLYTTMDIAKTSPYIIEMLAASNPTAAAAIPSGGGGGLQSPSALAAGGGPQSPSTSSSNATTTTNNNGPSSSNSISSTPNNTPNSKKTTADNDLNKKKSDAPIPSSSNKNKNESSVPERNGKDESINKDESMNPTINNNNNNNSAPPLLTKNLPVKRESASSAAEGGPGSTTWPSLTDSLNLIAKDSKTAVPESGGGNAAGGDTGSDRPQRKRVKKTMGPEFVEWSKKAGSDLDLEPPKLIANNTAKSEDGSNIGSNNNNNNNNNHRKTSTSTMMNNNNSSTTMIMNGKHPSPSTSAADAALVGALDPNMMMSGDDHQDPDDPNMFCDSCTGSPINNKYGLPEKLLICQDCPTKVHPSCLGYDALLTARCRQSPWQCADCKTCVYCGTSEDSEHLLFCDCCDQAYHMACHLPPLKDKPAGKWSCQECRLRRLDVAAQQHKKVNNKSKKSNAKVRNNHNNNNNNNNGGNNSNNGSNNSSHQFTSPPSTTNTNHQNHQEDHQTNNNNNNNNNWAVLENDSNGMSIDTTNNNNKSSPTLSTPNKSSSTTPTKATATTTTTTSTSAGSQNEVERCYLSLSNLDHMPACNCDNAVLPDLSKDERVVGGSEDAKKWTVSDVTDYVTGLGFPVEAMHFKDQMIDGQALLLMKRVDIISSLQLKLGPALKLYRRISALQRSHERHHESGSIFKHETDPDSGDSDDIVCLN